MNLTRKNFILYKLLGKGSFSSVYESLNLLNNNKVALKIIEKVNIKKLNISERIIQEINIHQSINHNNVCKLYNTFNDILNIYLILEYCEYGDLGSYLYNNRIESGGLDENIVRSIFFNIVLGVKYLHDNGIVHRDLKLSNILLTNDLTPKIADFGMACKIKNSDLNFTMCGTPNYIAPEILNKKGHSFAVDAWSLGCLLYTLLIGSPPFESDNLNITLDRIKSASFNYPPYFNTSAKALINKLLQVEPNARPDMNEILNSEWLFVQKAQFDEDSKSNNNINNLNTSFIDTICMQKEEPMNLPFMKYKNVFDKNKSIINQHLPRIQIPIYESEFDDSVIISNDRSNVNNVTYPSIIPSRDLNFQSSNSSYDSSKYSVFNHFNDSIINRDTSQRNNESILEKTGIENLNLSKISIVDVKNQNLGASKNFNNASCFTPALLSTSTTIFQNNYSCEIDTFGLLPQTIASDDYTLTIIAPNCVSLHTFINSRTALFANGKVIVTKNGSIENLEESLLIELESKVNEVILQQKKQIPFATIEHSIGSIYIMASLEFHFCFTHSFNNINYSWTMFASDKKIILTSAYEGDENDNIPKTNSPVIFELENDLPLSFPQCLNSNISHIFFDEINLPSHVLLIFLSQLKSICLNILKFAKEDYFAPKVDDSFNPCFNKLRGIVDFDSVILKYPYYFKLLSRSYLPVPNFTALIKSDPIPVQQNQILLSPQNNSEVISTQTLEGVGTAYLYPTSILTQLNTGESMSFNPNGFFFMHENNIAEFKNGDIVPENIKKFLTIAKSIFNKSQN